MSLAIRNLAIGYGQRRVGEGIDFTLGDGETLCLLGPNGCGKTTLFRTLLGLLPALEGRVELDGADMAHRSRADIARRIAYVPQAQASAFPFTVREMVVMGRAARLDLLAAPSHIDHHIADNALGRLGIAHLAERVFTEISGGERQLALIARALTQEAAILVMDEPTASLDFGNQVRVLEQMRALSHGGQAIVFATHDPDHAFLCADRVALMHQGRMIALGTPDETVTAAYLKTIYGVEVVIATLPETGRRVCAPSLGTGA